MTNEVRNILLGVLASDPKGTRLMVRVDASRPGVVDVTAQKDGKSLAMPNSLKLLMYLRSKRKEDPEADWNSILFQVSKGCEPTEKFEKR